MAKQEIIKCGECGEPAKYKASGGPVLRKATKYGHDIPEPQNHVFRCQKHQDYPEPRFGKLWLWEYVNKDSQ